MKFECRLCGGHSEQHIDAVDAKSKENLPISVCKDCGLVQQTVLPSDDELRIYYSHNYRTDYKNTYEPKLKYVRRAGLAAKNRIDFLCEYVAADSAKRLLDVGAGGGEFVYLSSKAGFDASGIEPNEGYSQFSKREYGIDVKTMMLDGLENGSADVVTLFHVYEHMANPFAVMDKIAEILSEGGYLFIEVPNILQNDASPHNIFFKAHLFYYSRYTLAAFASKQFDVVQIEDKGNIRALFKKKEKPEVVAKLPGEFDVQHTFERLAKKGWLEYIFVGGGLLKPFRKIKQILMEKNIANIKPKELLDLI